MDDRQDMRQDLGASVPDQALAVPAEPVARLGPSGFDPSRVMRQALEEIRDLEPEPFMGFPSDWRDQIDACQECQRYRSHPIQQGICDEHRRPLWAERKHDDHERVRLGYRAMNIAANALTAIAMEARQGTDPKGLDGKAATARAGTASPKVASPAQSQPSSGSSA